MEDNNLCSKCVDNPGVAENHQRQRQQVGDEHREESNALLHGVTLVDGESHTLALDDVRGHNGERYLDCRNNGPDESDCSTHETLLHDQLQNAN